MKNKIVDDAYQPLIDSSWYYYGMYDDVKRITNNCFKYLKKQGVAFSENYFEVRNFKQLWGSTALGFGGMGGDAMTYAFTTVIIGIPMHDITKLHAYVFWDGRFAYEVGVSIPNKDKSVFMNDINHCKTADIKTCEERYKND